jgi:hypothetical protein
LIADRGLKLADIGEGAAADCLAGDDAEKVSTLVSHEQLVGAKCSVTLRFLSSYARMPGCLWVAQLSQLSQLSHSRTRGWALATSWR